MNAMMAFKAQNLGPFINYAASNRRNTRCIATTVPLKSPVSVSYHLLSFFMPTLFEQGFFVHVSSSLPHANTSVYLILVSSL